MGGNARGGVDEILLGINDSSFQHLGKSRVAIERGRKNTAPVVLKKARLRPFLPREHEIRMKCQENS